MILHQAGESIECSRCEIFSRNIRPSSLQTHKKLGRIVKYECIDDSSAKNIKELNPKEYHLKLTSNLDLGTQLNAKGIFILTKQMKPIKKEVVNKSGRHKASMARLKQYVYAEIKYPMDNVINSMNKRNQLS